MAGAPDFIIRGRLVIDEAPVRAPRQAVNEAKKAEKAMDHMQQHGMGIGMKLMNMFMMVSMVAAPLVASLAGVVKIHSEIEQATTGIASLLSAQRDMPINAALKTAGRLVKELNLDAAHGVGALDDYTRGLQTILGPSLNIGASLDQMRQLNKLALTAGFAMRGQEGMQLASLDVVQALTSGASGRMTPIVTAAITALGVTQEAFNSMGGGERFATLLAAFGKFQGGVEAMGRTWDAQTDTLLDGVKRVIRAATTPVFERWKTQIMSANKWLSKHQDTISRITGIWGTRMLGMWDDMIRKASLYAAIVTASTVVYLAPGGGGGKGGGKVRGWMSEFGAATRDPLGMGRLIGGSLSAFGGKATGTAGMGAVLGSGLADIGGMLGGLALKALSVVGPVALLTTAFLAVKGAISEYPKVLGFVKVQFSALLGTLSKLGDTFANLTGANSGLNLLGGLLLGLAGVALRVVDVLGRALGVIGEIIGQLLRLVGQGYKSLYLAATGDSSAIMALKKQVGAQNDESNKRILGYFGLGGSKDKPGAGGFESGLSQMLQDLLDRKAGTPDTPKDRGGDNTVINIAKIEITAERLDDPAKVAGSFEALAAKLARNRLQARRIPSPALG